jgi:IS30 family transposase
MNALAPARRRWTTDETKKLGELAKAGKTAPEIATALQRTPQSIYSQLKRLDIKGRKGTRWRLQRQKC